MRFILNFIFFGFLYYVIYLFFPDAFHTLVSWANTSFDYLRELFLQLSGKIQKGDQTLNPVPQQALLWILFSLKPR